MKKRRELSPAAWEVWMEMSRSTASRFWYDDDGNELRDELLAASVICDNHDGTVELIDRAHVAGAKIVEK